MEKHSMEMQKKGLIFGIQHFSIHDGDGIRSSVFFKGCPLRCLWCHNPEGLYGNPELQYYEKRCVKCGRCGFVYRGLGGEKREPIQPNEHGAKICIHHALEQVGTWMTVDEIIEEVMEDQKFFQSSKGGITVSGGEPMMQVCFAYALLKEAKGQGLSTAMETSGYAKWEDYEKVCSYVDEFLWDYKESDRQKHKEFTGVQNDIILKNLERLYKKGAVITLRCPIIPEINDTKEHLQAIAQITKDFPKIKGAEIMPYHNMGVAKGKRIKRGKQQEFRVPAKEVVEQWKRDIVRFGGRIL